MTVDTEDARKDALRIGEEAELVRRVRLGDREAFRPLVERYQGRVYGIALRILGDPHEAEDVCQEVFVRAYRALSGFDTRFPFSNWLLRIATNLSRTFLRRRRSAASLLGEGPAVEAGESPGEKEENLASLREGIKEALDRLSERKRTALLLFHQSERSYADIAEIMDLPLGTVKTAIHRARNEIRRALSDRGLL